MDGESNVSFSGHKSAVTVLHYDSLGARLVTGSRVSCHPTVAPSPSMKDLFRPYRFNDMTCL